MEGVTACLVGRAERRRGIGLAQPESSGGLRSQSVRPRAEVARSRPLPVPRSTAGAGRSPAAPPALAAPVRGPPALGRGCHYAALRLSGASKDAAG